MNMKIRKLEFDVRSKLESGLVITDATQCALELVENALDAKCTAVAVGISLADYKIEVIDNGIGISLNDLNLIGERFMTSKCKNVADLNNNIETFGYRGQALASIIDVSSKLIIKTVSKFNSKKLVKVFMKGKCPSISAGSKDKCSTGTTITVYDFMSTMPVRRKRIREIFDIQEIKKQFEYLALIHNEVSFTLWDESKREIIFQSQTRRNAGLSFADLFGMAIGKFLVPIQFMECKIEIEGFIGLERHSENNLQFFYINRRIVSKSIVHKFINGLINKYLNNRLTLFGELSDLKKVNLNYENSSHNVYLIHIRCPYSYYELFRNLRKTTVEFKNWDQIFHCLKSAVKTVLNVKTLNTEENCIIHKKRNENIKNFPKEKKMDLDQLKCGIRGVCVKRNLRDNMYSDKKSIKSINSQISPIQKKILNDENKLNQCKIFDEIENNISGRKGIFDYCDANNKVDTWIKSETKKVDEKKSDFVEESKNEGIYNNFLIEFAGWLKIKIENDKFLRKMYWEFIEERVAVCEKLKNLKLEKRKWDFFSEREENERKNDKKKIFKGPNEMKRLKLSIAQLNLSGNNKKVKHSEKEFVKKLKVKGKSYEHRFLRKEIPGKSFKNIKSGNELIECSPISISSNFTRDCIKQFKSYVNSENYFTQGESLNSWVSHENRNKLNEEYLNSSTANISMNSINKIKYNFFKNGNDKNVISSNKVEENKIHGHREVEVQTSITTLHCEKGIQINFHEKNYENGESNIMLSPSLNSMSAGFSNNLNGFGDPPKSSNHKNINNVSACKNSKEIVPDTLSLFEDEYFHSRNSPTPFACINRYTFIPKGLSPMILDRSCMKFGSGSEEIMEKLIEASNEIREGNSCDLFSKSLLPQEIIEDLQENVVKNMIYYESELIKSYMTKTGSNINYLFNSLPVDKKLLSKIKVIGQWDNKFIIGKTCRVLPEEKYLLFVFDQHAVDERICLEKLLKDSRNNEGKFISVNCNPPIICKMEKSTLRYIPSMERILLNFGMKLSIVDLEHVIFREIPICFTEFNDNNVEMLLKTVINEIVEEFKETRGSCPTIPRTMATLMSTKACKSAIKFNDVLSLDEMEKMINGLIMCQIPFQCAHGRPSLVPILDLQITENQIKKNAGEKLNFKKFKKWKSD